MWMSGLYKHIEDDRMLEQKCQINVETCDLFFFSNPENGYIVEAKQHM